MPAGALSDAMLAPAKLALVPSPEPTSKWNSTLMVRNIPTKMTTAKLLVTFGTLMDGADFFYCPTDERRGRVSSRGYAFINFVDVCSLWRFVQAWGGRSWPNTNSTKVGVTKCA